MKTKRIEQVCLSFWPLNTVLLTYILVPGYVIPFLNNPYARLVILFGLIWLVIGFFVIGRCSRLWQTLLAQLVFAIPFMLMIMIGPVLTPILRPAFHVLTSSK